MIGSWFFEIFGKGPDFGRKNKENRAEGSVPDSSADAKLCQAAPKGPSVLIVKRD